MHPRQCLPTVAVSLAAAQGQSISWTQLRRFGLSEKVIRRMSKEWSRLGRGVYCLTSPQWPSAAWAGLLVGGDSATVGGLAAAHLYGWSPTAPARITIWTNTRAAPWQIGEWRVIFRRGPRSARGQIRRTSPEETLLDVASECGSGGGRDPSRRAERAEPVPAKIVEVYRPSTGGKPPLSFSSHFLGTCYPLIAPALPALAKTCRLKTRKTISGTTTDMNMPAISKDSSAVPESL